jgi:predicted mannosyl-3-phosphoglycerate phosphatase (HAD superfamily)
MQEKHLKKFSVEIESIKETDKLEVIYGGNPIKIDQQDLIDLVYRKIGRYNGITLATLAKNRVKIRRKIRKKINKLEEELKFIYFKSADAPEIVGKIKGLKMCLKLLDKQKDW